MTVQAPVRRDMAGKLPFMNFPPHIAGIPMVSKLAMNAVCSPILAKTF